MKIKIEYDKVFDWVLDQVGMIGKRVKTEKGEPSFTNFTLSSREKPVIVKYMQEAVQNVFASAPERMTDYHIAHDAILLSVVGGDDNDNLVELFGDTLSSYVRNYCLAQYLNMTAPDYAKKYVDETESIATSLISMLFYKSNVLTASEPLVDTNGVVFDYNPFKQENDEEDTTEDSTFNCHRCC